MPRSQKFNVSDDDAKRIEAWINQFSEELENYKAFGRDFAGQVRYIAEKKYGEPAWKGLSNRIENNEKNGLAKLQGKQSRLYIGEMHVTADTPPEDIIYALFELPSPFLDSSQKTKTQKPNPHARYAFQKNDDLTNFKFSKSPQQGDNPAIKDAKHAYNEAQRLARAGKIDDAAEGYLSAAGIFLNHGLTNLAHASFYMLSEHLSAKVSSILKNDEEKIKQLKRESKYSDAWAIEYSDAWAIEENNKKEAQKYEVLLAYASDAAYKCEHGNKNDFAIQVDEGLGGFLQDRDYEKAGTGNLRDCHLLAIKTEYRGDIDAPPQSVSYVTHNDRFSSVSCDKPFDFMPEGKSKVIIAGGNSFGSLNALINVLNAVYSMAATGREISIEQSHLLQRGNVSAVSCTYHPKEFTMSLQAPGLVHPDQIIGSGWHLMNTNFGRYQPVSFDTRYGDIREINCNIGDEYGKQSSKSEDRFAIGLTSSAVYKVKTANLSDTYAATNKNIATHTGHWYNETAAIKSAVESAQVQIAKNLLNDANFLDRLQKKYSLGDPVLAQAEVVRKFNEFPVFIGKEGEKSNTYLSALIKEVMLSNNDFSVFDDEFLTHIQYDIVQGKNEHPFLETHSSALPPLEQRLEARGQPLIVHPSHRDAIVWCSDTIRPVLSDDLQRMTELFDTQRASLGKSLVQNDYLYRMLNRDPNQDIEGYEKIAVQRYAKYPVFIGSGADWANKELPEVLVETSNNPAYSKIFDKFDEQSAALLSDVQELILVQAATRMQGLNHIKLTH
jgi:hypothetical protein